MKELTEIAHLFVGVPGGLTVIVLLAAFALSAFAIYAVLKAAKGGG